MREAYNEFRLGLFNLYLHDLKHLRWKWHHIDQPDCIHRIHLKWEIGQLEQNIQIRLLRIEWPTHHYRMHYYYIWQSDPNLHQ